jgi:uncharacterized protein (TIGR00156 family)
MLFRAYIFLMRGLKHANPFRRYTMKKYMLFLACCLVSLVAAATVSAQGFTGPGSPPPPPPGGPYGPPPPPPGGPGHYPPPPPPPPGDINQYGFTGPVRTVTVEQAKTYAHRTPVIVSGTIVQAIGGDLYIFRDSSGEIILRIGPREWYALGSNIGPSEKIEISGELHRDHRDWQRAPEIHARYIRKI